MQFGNIIRQMRFRSKCFARTIINDSVKVFCQLNQSDHETAVYVSACGALCTDQTNHGKAECIFEKFEVKRQKNFEKRPEKICFDKNHENFVDRLSGNSRWIFR